MTRSAKKLLAKQSLELSRVVTAERLKQAGVTFGDDLGLKDKKAPSELRLPRGLLKQLAGR